MKRLSSCDHHSSMSFKLFLRRFDGEKMKLRMDRNWEWIPGFSFLFCTSFARKAAGNCYCEAYFRFIRLPSFGTLLAQSVRLFWTRALGQVTLTLLKISPRGLLFSVLFSSRATSLTYFNLRRRFEAALHVK